MQQHHHVVRLRPQCFAVRSLGWVEMAEEDLAPGKSSVAVNNCIRQLSYCKNDIRDTVGIWGEVSVIFFMCVFAFCFGCKIKGGQLLEIKDLAVKQLFKARKNLKDWIKIEQNKSSRASSPLKCGSKDGWRRGE